MNHLIGFLEGIEGQKSLSRLLLLGSFLISSAIMFVLTWRGSMNEGYFGLYLTAFATSYLGGKALDRKVNVSTPTAE